MRMAAMTTIAPATATVGGGGSSTGDGAAGNWYGRRPRMRCHRYCATASGAAIPHRHVQFWSAGSWTWVDRYVLLVCLKFESCENTMTEIPNVITDGVERYVRVESVWGRLLLIYFCPCRLYHDRPPGRLPSFRVLCWMTLEKVILNLWLWSYCPRVMLEGQVPFDRSELNGTWVSCVVKIACTSS